MNDMALHFLAKMKILVVKDIEREDIEFISKVRSRPSPFPQLHVVSVWDIVHAGFSLRVVQVSGIAPLSESQHYSCN